MEGERLALDRAQIEQAIVRLAGEIRDAEPGGPGLCLVGIRRGGIPVAERIGAELEARMGVPVPRGTLDIGLYRDDVPRVRPVVGPTDIPFSIEERAVVLVDDVLFTGRTVRAALDQLMDFGRPRRVYLAVLVERAGRELPICADFVGAHVECAPEERVQVRLGGPGEDAVVVSAQRARQEP
jgi:pyrimidine operon attenuation protein/uracil phosphoribosyltransferase